jgi:outer membrane autotransporter protein
MSIKNFISATFIVVLLSNATFSFAEGGYIGGQLAQTTYEQKGTAADGEADPKAIILVGGYEFNEHIAIEGRLGFGVGEDDYSTGVEIELSQLVSVLGKFSLGGPVSPYLLVGFSNIEYDDRIGDTSKTDGASFGAGVDFEVSQNTSLNLEYIQYGDDNGAGGGSLKASAISIGVNYSF